MPSIDYAFLADFVRSENGGVGHALGIGIDTLTVPSVPSGRNVGLFSRILFTRGECGRPHRVEVLCMDEDGAQLVRIDTTVVPEYGPNSEPSWPVGGLLALNLGVPLPRYGLYAIELLVDNQNLKTISFRCVAPAVPEQRTEP